VQPGHESVSEVFKGVVKCGQSSQGGQETVSHQSTVMRDCPSGYFEEILVVCELDSFYARTDVLPALPTFSIVSRVWSSLPSKASSAPGGWPIMPPN